MALTLPGADVRLLSGKSTTPLSPQVITIHTMVGTVGGTEAWFTPSGRPYSIFGLGGDGRFRQWQDLRFRAASDLEGNWRAISIECEDSGVHFPSWSGSDVPAFTDRQVDALIVALSWLCHRFGLPRSAIRSSCIHERGIGYHRLGIDHSTYDPNAPGGPWRTPGCPHWSSSRGKVCPGDRRIAQLRNEIIPAVSAPSSPRQRGFLMDLTDKEQHEALEILRLLKENTGPTLFQARKAGGAVDQITEIHRQVTADADGAGTLAERVRQDRLGRDEKEIVRPMLNEIKDKLDQLLADR